MAGDYIIQKAIDRKDMSAKAVRETATKEYDVQPKYDGCHMVVVLTPDSSCESGTSWDTYSATGEVVLSCAHIGEQLVKCLEVSEPIAICGEVWLEDTAFPEISGAFRRHAPQPQLKFAAFDTVGVAGYNLGLPILADHRGYKQRVQVLRDPRYKGESLIPFASSPDSSCDAEGYAQYLKEKGGYDGAIIHDVHAPYKVGRCRQGEVIKIKPLLSFDLMVTGVEKAIGTKTGKNTGALVCRFKDDAEVRVATGLTQAEVENIDSFIGKIIEVEAMAITKDGLLREPRFKGIRYDKAAPDF